MRVLVTGGAGYIGSQTAKELARAGHEPIVLDDLSTGHEWAVKWGPLVRACTGDRDLVRTVLRDHQPEAVIHFAANAYVGESMHDPGKYFRNNVVNTLNLLDEIVDDGVRPFVFSSSCATYGMPSEVPIPETEPQEPINPYGESKLMVEKVLRWYGEIHDLPWAALRYFNAAGADPDGELGEVHDPETHLIPRAIQAALGELPEVGIYGTDYPTPDGTAVRDYIHVTDLADAHIRAIYALGNGHDSLALNLGTSTGHSVREVIGAVERVSGRSVPVAAEPRRPGDPPVLVAAAGLAGETLGWKPEHSDLDAIVGTAWQWHEGR
ncbi:MAG: UDP-glucose 4-epimerase GalE [Acidimicrobiia bacterium]|nr:UDP-glucose 4-epimerase GalE [Acidimicrobiia bacterium]